MTAVTNEFTATTANAPEAITVASVGTDMPTSHPTSGPTAVPVNDDDKFPTIEVALPLSVIGFFGLAGLSTGKAQEIRPVRARDPHQ